MVPFVVMSIRTREMIGLKGFVLSYENVTISPTTTFVCTFSGGTERKLPSGLKLRR